ncbi:MAG: hydrolase [Aestuariibacter sp.]
MTKANYPTFNAPHWAKNPHFQTILPRLLFTKSLVDVEWQNFATRDGDRIELAWFKRGVTKPKAVVCIFHGLEGSVNSHYITTLVPKLNNDFWVVVVHFRGCGRTPNELPRSYHSGDTGDALEVAESLRQQYPHLPLHAIGFSLGGNMLLKLLGENSTTLFSSAVAVSPPFNLAKCASSISNGFSRIYERHLLRSMRQRFKQKAVRHNYQELINLSEEKLFSLDSFWAFDEHITGPLHGFKDANDYYQKSSSISFMAHINTRTLVLHALDDPFMSPDIVPNKQQISDKVTLEVSAHGGHVGFMQGTPWRPTLWLPGRIKHYFETGN